MTEAQAKPSADETASQASDYTTSLLGVVAIVGGVATGLFSDLRPFGQLIGLLAFLAWIHIEVVEPECVQAKEDIRIRSEDLQAVLPAK